MKVTESGPLTYITCGQNKLAMWSRVSLLIVMMVRLVLHTRETGDSTESTRRLTVGTTDTGDEVRVKNMEILANVPHTPQSPSHFS